MTAPKNAAKTLQIKDLSQCGQAGTAAHGRCFCYHRNHNNENNQPGGRKLASRNELSSFLADVERRAFKQAVFAVRDEQAALDIVQDAMLRLAEHYGDRLVSELPPLFQRILQNAIRDWYRRQKVRSLWMTMFSSLSPPGREDEDHDPLEALESADDSARDESPQDLLERSQVIEIIEEEISKLPARQRQAFLLRYWEELDVAETAMAMGCSEGSVKTHCSRAARALSGALRARGVVLDR